MALEPGGEEDLLVSGDVISFTENAVNLEKLIGTFVHDTDLGASEGAHAGVAAAPSWSRPESGSPAPRHHRIHSNGSTGAPSGSTNGCWTGSRSSPSPGAGTG